MEQSSGQRTGIKLQINKDESNLQGMYKIRLAGKAHLAFVSGFCKFIGTLNQFQLFSRNILARF